MTNETTQGRGFSPEEWDQFRDLIETQTVKFFKIAEDGAYNGAKKAISEHKTENCGLMFAMIREIQSWLLMIRFSIRKQQVSISLSLILIIVFFLLLF